MSESWQELAMIAFIVVGIAAAIWKGGQANPEGTGSLGKKLARLESDVRTVKRDVSGVVSSVDAQAKKTDAIEHQIQDIERRSAKASDIERLERLVVEQGRQNAELRSELAKISEAGEQRGKQLDRLYDFIVQKGMNA